MKTIKNFLKSIIRAIAIVLAIIAFSIEDIILRLCGYKRIEEIRIPYYKTRPRERNIEVWKMFYKEFGRLPAITIDYEKFLLDGFSIYIAACEMDFEYIKVTRVKRKNNRPIRKVNDERNTKVTVEK